LSYVYQHCIRPLLFTQDSEKIHDRTLRALEFASRRRILRNVAGTFCRAPELPVELFGLKFPNPVGLAAGMDKAARAVPIWPELGFGFSELGGITQHAQPGNPQPRMFRAIADRALINRMGFNNPGAEAAAEKLAEWKKLGLWPSHPVGMNLGKSKITPLEQAAEDYTASFQ
jgi:dihydroorotate dehydrogenase